MAKGRSFAAVSGLSAWARWTEGCWFPTILWLLGVAQEASGDSTSPSVSLVTFGQVNPDAQYERWDKGGQEEGS